MINVKLRPKILDLKPGTRVVSNSFTMEDWEAGSDRDAHRRLHELVHGAAVDRAGESRRHVDDAAGRPEAHADVPEALRHARRRHKVEGKMNGDQITLTAGKTTYTGKVNGHDDPRDRVGRRQLDGDKEVEAAQWSRRASRKDASSRDTKHHDVPSRLRELRALRDWSRQRGRRPSDTPREETEACVELLAG